MKILHSADWHLGRTINGFNLIELQQDMIQQIIDIIKKENVDVVVLAGDIYDRAIPGLEATQVLDNFLTEVTLKFKKQIILISGNHDSYERLGFGNELFRQVGVHYAKTIDGPFEVVKINDQYGPVNFYLWPYNSYFLLKEKHSDKQFTSYNDAFKYLLSKYEIKLNERNCFVGHSYFTYGMQKALESDSERQLSVGGVDFLDAKLLKDFDIAMFGHLHGPQKVGPELFRYAGSPLKYSFSEVNQQKSVVIYELFEKEKITYKKVPITPLYDMKIIKGYLKDIVENGVEGVSKNDLIQLILKDEERIYEPMATVRIRYPNVLELKYEEKQTEIEFSFDGPETKSKDIVELFSEFYEKINKNSLNEKQLEVVKKVYQKLLEAEVNADY